MDIEKALKDKSQKEKVKIKSRELAKVKIDKFEKGNLYVEIIGGIIEIDGGIELFARAFNGGKKIGFGKDGTVEIERFRFYDMPILVEAENGNIIKEWVDTLTGEKKQIKLEYNPLEAVKIAVVRSISIVGKNGKKIIKGKIGNTTSNFYSSTSGSPADGWVERSSVSESWSSIRGGAGNNSFTHSTTSNNCPIITTTDGTTFTELGRAIFLFNTAIIDTNTIDSATFSFNVDNSGNGTSPGQTIGLCSASPANSATLVDSDYGNTGNIRYASDVSISNGSKMFTLNSIGKEAINKSGITGFSMKLSGDIDNSAPGYGSYGQARASISLVSSSNDPVLTIEHSEVKATGNFFQLF